MCGRCRVSRQRQRPGRRRRCSTLIICCAYVTSTASCDTLWPLSWVSTPSNTHCLTQVTNNMLAMQVQLTTYVHCNNTLLLQCMYVNVYHRVASIYYYVYLVSLVTFKKLSHVQGITIVPVTRGQKGISFTRNVVFFTSRSERVSFQISKHGGKELSTFGKKKNFFIIIVRSCDFIYFPRR